MMGVEAWNGEKTKPTPSPGRACLTEKTPLEKSAQHCIREEMLVSLHSAHFVPSEQQVVTVFNYWFCSKGHSPISNPSLCPRI